MRKEKVSLHCVVCGKKSKQVFCSEDCRSWGNFLGFVWPLPKDVKLSAHLAGITGVERVKKPSEALKQHKSTLKNEENVSKLVKKQGEVVVE